MIGMYLCNKYRLYITDHKITIRLFMIALVLRPELPLLELPEFVLKLAMVPLRTFMRKLLPSDCY